MLKVGVIIVIGIVVVALAKVLDVVPGMFVGSSVNVDATNYIYETSKSHKLGKSNAETVKSPLSGIGEAKSTTDPHKEGKQSETKTSPVRIRTRYHPRGNHHDDRPL